MIQKNVLKEFVEILEYYMGHYGLYNIDIKHLLKSSTDIVSDLRKGKKGPTITKVESIAKLFGLRYYQFCNPDFPLPPYDKLPKSTIEVINKRKEIGPPELIKYNKIELNKIVLNILNKFFKEKEFLPSEVYKRLPKDLQEKLGSATRITGLFSNELKVYVEKT